MEQILNYFGICSFATILAFGLIKFFSQKIFENYLAKSIETHKSNLERINISHEIQFASLHKERAIVIRELYQQLIDYERIVISFFNIDLYGGKETEDFKSRLDKWNKFAPEFSWYFNYNRIYFNNDLCSIIDKLIDELDKINSETKTFLQSFNLIPEQVAAIKSKDDRFVNLQKKVNYSLVEDISIITTDLENEFRKILGVA